MSKTTGTGPLVDLGFGMSASETIRASFDSPDLPCLVEVEATFQGERYEVTSLRCSQRPGDSGVSTDGLRRIRVHHLVTAMLVEHLWKGSTHVFEDRPVRPRVSDEATLRYVAMIYRSAFVVQADPGKAVAQNLELPPATASRWIKRAREQGFITETAPRRQEA